MRVSLMHRRVERGGALLLAMIAILVIGTAVLSSINLVSSANRDAYRSEAWNEALVVAEAGVEEALAHLQLNYPSNLVSHDWQVDTGNIAQTRQLGASSYKVSTSLEDNPVIISRGTTQLGGEQAFITRTLQIQTVQTGLLMYAFASKLNVKLNGHNISTDSYDSTDPEYSSPSGGYDPSKSKDGGDIATNLGEEWSFDAGNALVHGKISTGPDGSVKLRPGAVVGSDEWHASGQTGVQEGWLRDDSNVIMPPVEDPGIAGSFTPGGAVIDGTNYTTVLESDKYSLKKLSGKVLVTGNATLIVTEQLNISGQDYIRILPNASLKLYVAARTANVGGQGIINESSMPISFIYYGLPSNKTISLNGSGEMASVIYAPDTNIQLNGGGQFYGAIVGRSVTMNGDFDFHYDESLSRSQLFRWFKVLSWKEI